MSPAADEGGKSGRDAILKQVLDSLVNRQAAVETRLGSVEGTLREMKAVAEVRDVGKIEDRVRTIEDWRAELKGRTAVLSVQVAATVSIIVTVIGGLVLYLLTKGVVKP